jgi:hypothetical protein
MLRSETATNRCSRTEGRSKRAFRSNKAIFTQLPPWHCLKRSYSATAFLIFNPTPALVGFIFRVAIEQVSIPLHEPGTFQISHRSHTDGTGVTPQRVWCNTSTLFTIHRRINIQWYQHIVFYFANDLHRPANFGNCLSDLHKPNHRAFNTPRRNLWDPTQHKNVWKSG